MNGSETKKSIRDLKELAIKHIPKICEILKNEHKFWNKLQSKFQKKLENTSSGSITESSIPILVGQAELEDEISINFLKSIDFQIDSLRTKIPVNLKNKFIKMVENFIYEFDIVVVENPNPAYLNWLSEMLAINKLLDSKSYQLINFETKLSNGKKMDYELNDKNGIQYLIDVVNIHIPNQKAKTNELLKLTIDSKLENKFIDKTKNLDSSDRMFLLPIFWFDDEIKDKVLDYLQQAKFNDRKIISPCTFLFVNDKEYIFGTIESQYQLGQTS